jgi:hypothetical protein
MQKEDESVIAVLAPQNSDVIRRRQAIREAFHDSKALTIKGKRN